jgi:hypothetical protein
MKLLKILLILALVALLITILTIISLVYIQNNLTGRVIDEFTHTKAICNTSNFCQDYEITCKGSEIVKQQPITGAVIQHNENWQDPRTNPQDLCQ